MFIVHSYISDHFILMISSSEYLQSFNYHRSDSFVLSLINQSTTTFVLQNKKGSSLLGEMIYNKDNILRNKHIYNESHFTMRLRMHMILVHLDESFIEKVCVHR